MKNVEDMTNKLKRSLITHMNSTWPRRMEVQNRGSVQNKPILSNWRVMMVMKLFRIMIQTRTRLILKQILSWYHWMMGKDQLRRRLQTGGSVRIFLLKLWRREI